MATVSDGEDETISDLCLWEKLLIAAQKNLRLSKMLNGIFSAGQLESYKSDIKGPF